MIHYAIEIETGVAVAVASIGHTIDGFIRLVTDRPGYDGNPTYPVWEDDSNNTDVWYEGIILRDGIGSPNRRIDIDRTGGYGTTEGMVISLSNENKYWYQLENNSIFLLNRTIKLYVVIDDKFYQVFNGVISNDQYTETDYVLTCSASYRIKHKNFPPNVINDNNYPNAREDVKGSVLPVCFGDINYAKTYNVDDSDNRMLLVTESADYRSSKVAPVIDYDAGVDPLKIGLYTPDTTHAASKFQNKYLVVIAGNSANNGKLYKITDSDATDVSDITYVYTEVRVNEVSDISDYLWYEDFNAYNIPVINIDTWFCSIIDNKANRIFSNALVNDYKYNDFGVPLIYGYEEDSKTFNEISDQVDALTTTSDRDYIQLLTSTLSEAGDIDIFQYHEFENIKFWKEFLVAILDTEEEWTINYNFSTENNHIDHDRSTFNSDNILTWVDGSKGTSSNTWDISTATPDSPQSGGVNFQFDFSDDINFEDIDELYIGLDVQLGIAAADVGNTLGMGIRITAIDKFNNFISPEVSPGSPLWDGRFVSCYDQVTDAITYFNFIPNNYYKNVTVGNGDNGEDSIYYEYDERSPANKVSDYCKVDDNVLTMIKSGFIRGLVIGFCFYVPGANVEIEDIRIREMVLFSKKTVGARSDNIYVRIDGGEENGVAHTDDVYNAFEKLLEGYDGISSSDIDYDNLSSYRNSWDVGRQVNEATNSFDYLKELAEQSFVGIFESRTGEIKLKAWRHDTSSAFAFDESTILRDSIQNYERIPIENVYNEFYLKYDWNYAEDKFNRMLTIKNVDQSGFPARYESVEGSDVEVTGGNITYAIVYDSDGSGYVTFDADITGQISVGDYISIWMNSGAFAEWAVVTSIDATVTVNFENPQRWYVLTGDYSEDTGGTCYAEGGPTTKWITYVDGINNHTTAQSLWDACHDSYLYSLSIRRLPDELSNLYWYTDRSIFENRSNGALLITESPYKYLQDCIEWTSIPKYKTEFSLPINATNIIAELLDYATFYDTIYTNGINRYGWITKIQLNPSENTMNVELTLEPTDVSISTSFIIETGSAADTITESGSQPDTITEGA